MKGGFKLPPAPAPPPPKKKPKKTHSEKYLIPRSIANPPTTTKSRMSIPILEYFKHANL